MTLNSDIPPDNRREKFDRFLGKATLPATLLGIFVLFFSVDDPVGFLLGWFLMALFAGAAIGVMVIVIRMLRQT